MSVHSVIDAETLQAYLETEYHVQGERCSTLHIGRPNTELADLHYHYGVRCSAFLTACNPYSQYTDEAENQSRQAKLIETIRQRGLHCIPGMGQHPSNNWPGEPSLLVLGLERETARAIGRAFEQNAIVVNGARATPELVLLR